MEIHRKIAWIMETGEEIERAFIREEIARNLNNTGKVLKLCWKPSHVHRFTVNVDGSVRASKRVAAIEGVIRNESGSWVEGFSNSEELGDTSVIETKAIVEGLQWAWTKGIQDVEI